MQTALFNKPHNIKRADQISAIVVSAGFRWWGPAGPGVVGGPMCGYKIFR